MIIYSTRVKKILCKGSDVMEIKSSDCALHSLNNLKKLNP